MPTVDRRRLQALIDLDISFARQLCPRMPSGAPMSDEGLLAGLHKTRLHVPAVPTDYGRRDSSVITASFAPLLRLDPYLCW